MLESSRRCDDLGEYHPGSLLSQTGLEGPYLVHSDSMTAVHVLKGDRSGWTILTILLEFKNKSTLHCKA